MDDIVLVDDDQEKIIDKESLEKELSQLQKELSEVTSKIRRLEDRKRQLKNRVEIVREKIQKKESEALLEQDWETRKFAWSERLDVARSEIFNLSSFRPDQLAVINASMSGWLSMEK